MVRSHFISTKTSNLTTPFRLISASVATVVHYGFHCYPSTGHAFLGLCFATGLAGNILPFMDWFNKFEYRVRDTPSTWNFCLKRVLSPVLSDRILPLSGIRRNWPCRRNVHAAFHLGDFQFRLYVTFCKFEILY